VPPFGPISRRDFVRALKALGFDGPFSGGKHQFMVRDETTLRIPPMFIASVAVALVVGCQAPVANERSALPVALEYVIALERGDSATAREHLAISRSGRLSVPENLIRLSPPFTVVWDTILGDTSRVVIRPPPPVPPDSGVVLIEEGRDILVTLVREERTWRIVSTVGVV